MDTSRVMSGADGRGDERGYSIVELLVVMSVIAILVGVALPTFLGAAHKAEDQKAKADLRNGLAAALTHFAEAGAWDDFDAAEALLIEPTVVWIDGGAPTPGQISIQVHIGSELLMVRRSTSGDFFCVAQIAASPATSRGSGATFADVDTAAECTGGW